ncbi:(d)CMP kinase [Microvirga subterranea]|uniref:Cytidylate kinase n=1 Tax=Microvirga subterranea TaxID=186651 RepID=A0A370HLK2_9HYPH|nr:(d)CMP kinase [Microvirga subterranea]RDI59462.1 cytidylate kinase [Microvirga subterranea]
MIIAIDGPAASGKGTLGKRLADHFGFAHLDTGLLYRAVARVLLDRDVALTDRDAAARVAQELDVTHLDDERLRGAQMGEAASVISAYQPVRDALLAFQRQFAGQPPGAVLDGRDIGTVVCPHADVKLFITASAEERARRRHRELLSRGETTDYEIILNDIRRRDERDMTRSNAPLKAADDALTLDTTHLDADQAFQAALELVTRKQT